MKSAAKSRGARANNARSWLDPREHWILLLGWIAALAGAVVLAVPGPAWLGTAGEIAVFAMPGLVIWWALTGFSGYEHRIGLRIVSRPAPARGAPILAIVCLVAAAAGIAALVLGVHSALVVIATALLAGLALVAWLLRHFALFASLSIFGIALGVAALIVVQSVATGFQHEFERRVVGVYGHINVFRNFGLTEYRRFENFLRTLDGVVGASPFVYYTMALSPTARAEDGGEIRRATVLVKGIEPRTAHQVIDLEAHLAAASDEPVQITDLVSDLELQPLPDRPDDKLPEVIAQTPDPRGPDWYPAALAHWTALPSYAKYGRGRRATKLEGDDPWPDPQAENDTATQDAKLPTMFIGVTLASQLGLALGDVVTMVDPGAGWEHSEVPEFRRYRIAGVYRAGFQEFDSRLVYVDIRELQWFKYRGKDTASGVDLRLRDLYDAPEVETRVRDVLSDDEYSILEWEKLNANLFQSIQTQKSILTVILSLVSAVAGFNILAALWTMVVRRTNEIAILMSMGATAAGVGRIFQFAGMTLGVVGSLAGVAFGLVLCWLVELYGYTLDPEVYFIERLPVEFSKVQITAVLVLTMGIAFLATVPPSLRAARLRPVEGLRYE